MLSLAEPGTIEERNALHAARWPSILGHAALYGLASLLLLRLLHTVDRAPQANPSDPLALVFVFGAMVVLRLITRRAGLTGWGAVWLPALFIMALPFTFFQRTAAHDFGEWFALLLIAYVGLTGARWRLGLLVCVCAVATPVALYMPLICLPLFVRQVGWRKAAGFTILCIAAAWSVGILADAHAFGHPSSITLDKLNEALHKGWRVLTDGEPGGWRRVSKLLPTGANLLNVLVLLFLLERYVVSASREGLLMLALAVGCCIGLSAWNRQMPAHLLALVIPALFICLVDGMRRLPALFSAPPESIDIPARPLGAS